MPDDRQLAPLTQLGLTVTMQEIDDLLRAAFERLELDDYRSMRQVEESLPAIINEFVNSYPSDDPDLLALVTALRVYGKPEGDIAMTTAMLPLASAITGARNTLKDFHKRVSCSTSVPPKITDDPSGLQRLLAGLGYPRPEYETVATQTRDELLSVLQPKLDHPMPISFVTHLVIAWGLGWRVDKPSDDTRWRRARLAAAAICMRQVTKAIDGLSTDLILAKALDQLWVGGSDTLTGMSGKRQWCWSVAFQIVDALFDDPSLGDLGSEGDGANDVDNEPDDERGDESASSDGVWNYLTTTLPHFVQRRTHGGNLHSNGYPKWLDEFAKSMLYNNFLRDEAGIIVAECFVPNEQRVGLERTWRLTKRLIWPTEHRGKLLGGPYGQETLYYQGDPGETSKQAQSRRQQRTYFRGKRDRPGWYRRSRYILERSRAVVSFDAPLPGTDVHGDDRVTLEGRIPGTALLPIGVSGGSDAAVFGEFEALVECVVRTWWHERGNEVVSKSVTRSYWEHCAPALADDAYRAAMHEVDADHAGILLRAAADSEYEVEVEAGLVVRIAQVDQGPGRESKWRLVSLAIPDDAQF